MDSFSYVDGDIQVSDEIGRPVQKVGDVETNGMGVPIVKKKRGWPRKSEEERDKTVYVDGGFPRNPKMDRLERRRQFRKRDAAKVLKQTMTAGESFDWIVRNLELTEQQFRDLVPSDAPDSEAWLILSSAFADEDFRRLLQSKVLDRKMKRMENEQKRQFLDDGRAMDARLVELEGLLQGDDLLPKGSV